MIMNMIREYCIHFLPNKSFSQLLDIQLKKFLFLKNFNLEFSYIEIWFADQNSEPLIKIFLVIN